MLLKLKVNGEGIIFFLSLLFVVLFSFSSFGFVNIVMPQWINLASVLLIFIYLISKGKSLKVNKLLIYFIAYLFVSLLIDSPHPVFKSFERLCFFSSILLLISPIFQTNTLIKFRLISYRLCIYIFIALTLGSFIAYFLGINYMRGLTDVGDYSTAGHFSGLTNQSMVLGPFAGLSTLYFIYRYFQSYSKQYIVLIVICILTLCFSASRSALVATLGGCSVLLYKIFRNRLSKLFRLVIAISVVLAVSFPLWRDYISGFVQKSTDVNRTGVFDSRTTKFVSRLNEFTDNPITGIGFAAINPDGIDEYNRKTGNIEPGSSWLAIMSMSGVIGFTFIVIYIIRCFKNFQVYKNDYNINLPTGSLSLLLIHMLFEGYVFSMSNLICVFFWINTSIFYDLKYRNSYYNLKDCKCELSRL